jgi:hypothetical protein
MITVLEDSRIDASRLKVGYELLLQDSEYLERITGGTTDTLMVQRRIEICKRII